MECVHCPSAGVILFGSTLQGLHWGCWRGHSRECLPECPWVWWPTWQSPAYPLPISTSDAPAQCSAITQSRCHSSSWIAPTMLSIRLWQQKVPWRRQEGNLPSSLEWSGKRWAFQRAILLQVPPGKSEVQSCQVQPSMETYKHVPSTLCYFCVLLLAYLIKLRMLDWLITKGYKR